MRRFIRILGLVALDDIKGAIMATQIAGPEGRLVAGFEGAELLMDRAILIEAAMQGDQRVLRMPPAQILRQRHFLLGGRTGDRLVRRPQMRHELSRKRVDHLRALLRAGLLRDDQRRETETVHAEKAGAEGDLLLACQVCRIAPGEEEGARHRPFPRLGGAGEDDGVGGVEADGAWQQNHNFGPFASRQAQAASPSTSPRRRVSPSGKRSIRSPSAIARAPGSSFGSSRSRYGPTTASNP